ncbi:MAG: phosphohistidine phosphatase SixA [Myxococcales bacterium]|nr:phosphohistidine phosphatase SixA [Myxococcales bacterium]
MNVFVIRHARAIDPDRSLDDGHRPLTARGRRDALAVGRALREAGVKLDALVTSPLVRAVETAELIAVGLDFDGALEVAPELATGRHPQVVVEEILLPRADLGAVAVVGHEPQLGALIGALLRGPVPSPAKGAAVRLAWDGPGQPARFKWVIRPGFEKPSKEIADIG